MHIRVITHTTTYDGEHTSTYCRTGAFQRQRQIHRELHASIATCQFLVVAKRRLRGRPQRYIIT